MSNVQLGAGSTVSSAIFWKKKADRMVSQYRASALGTGRYAQLQGLERELNSFIMRVGRPLLANTSEGDALLRTYDTLALLEASERSISSKRIIDNARKAAAKVQAEAAQAAIDNAAAADKARVAAEQKVIAKAKIAEAEAQAEASQQAAKDRYETSRESEGGYTARIDYGRDLLDPPKSGYMAKGGLSMPLMLGLGGAALVAAYFVFKG